VVGVLLAVFLVVRLIPGDPVAFMLGDFVTPESYQRLFKALGFDEPVAVQYVRFVGQVMRGDLGRSIISQLPASVEIWSVAPHTFVLTIASMIIAVAIGVPAGVLSAVRRNSWVDHLVMALTLAGNSMPVFWMGILLLLLFSLYLGWFPAIGVARSSDLLTQARYLTLPATTLGVTLAPLIARMTRSAMLEVLREDYVRTARAKGLAERAVFYRHALRNAGLAIVTVVSLSFGIQLGGTILVESVFARPGMGSLLVNAILNRDYPLVQATVTVFALAFVLVNLVTDLAYAWLDPRIRYD